MTSAQISALVASTHNKVAAYWPVLFASHLHGKIGDYVSGNFGSAPTVAVAAASKAVTPAVVAETKKAAEPEPEKKVEEEIDLGGGLDMFGGGAAKGKDY